VHLTLAAVGPILAGSEERGLRKICLGLIRFSQGDDYGMSVRVILKGEVEDLAGTKLDVIWFLSSCVRAYD